MSQAIILKYLGPTNTRGSRIKATAAAGSFIHSWEYAHSDEQNYKQAMQGLIAKFNWSPYNWTIGTLPNGDHVAVRDEAKE